VKNIESIIDSLRATGGTNLSEGLEEGIQVAVGSKSENKVSAVLLLTDGHASVNNVAGLISKARGNKACSVFCFGFGADHDAKLLQKIADEGTGLYYFIEKEADISSAFADCLGGLISVACQKMILTIEPLSGVTIKRVLGSKASKKAAPLPLPSNTGDIKQVKLTRNRISGSSDEEDDSEEEKPTPTPEEQKQKEEEQRKKKKKGKKKLFPFGRHESKFFFAFCFGLLFGLFVQVDSIKLVSTSNGHEDIDGQQIVVDWDDLRSISRPDYACDR